MPHYEHIVILTGAGLSAESGASTFRGKDGIEPSLRWDVFDVAIHGPAAQVGPAFVDRLPA